MVPGSPQKIGAGLGGDGRAVQRDVLAVRLHGELLEVGGEALEVLLVGQHGDGLRVEEVGVPEGEQAEQHGQILLERGSPEVDVHGVEAGEHVAEVLAGRWRSWWRGRWRSPWSSGRRPSPRSRTCFRCRCRSSATFSALVEMATKCLATAVSSPPSPASDQSRAEWALVIVSCVVKVLEATMKSVSSGLRSRDGLGEVGAVDVGDEAEGEVALAVVLERLVGHHRAEVRAADADVDDVADGLAGVALPLAGADAVGEGGHLVEHRVDVGDDVFSVDEDALAFGRAQRDVQDGAVFGDVDLVAAKHGVDFARAGRTHRPGRRAGGASHR